MRAKRLEIVLLLLPALTFVVVFRVFPLVTALITSFHRYFGPHKSFIGLDNYRFIFSDPFILDSMRNTLLFNVITNPVQTLIALFLALLIFHIKRGQKIFKMIFFLPVVVPMSVASITWLRMLDPQSGLINGILSALGLPMQRFLTSERQALECIIAMVTWKGVGFWMIFFLAGLQNIPISIVESARVDGANYFQTLLFIIIPLLKRTIIFVLAADTAINFLLFAPVYMMTRGGPLGSTNLLMYEAYKTAFVYLDWGRASAITITTAIISLLAILIETKVLQARYEY